jgi:hypothetical protein
MSHVITNSEYGAFLGVAYSLNWVPNFLSFEVKGRGGEIFIFHFVPNVS